VIAGALTHTRETVLVSLARSAGASGYRSAANLSRVGDQAEHSDDIGERRPVYRVIERALWALGPALILFQALTYPSVQTARQAAAAQMDRVIAAENAGYYVKWGMVVGTPKHLGCIHDLAAIRARSEQRVRDKAVNDF
jgi:hypothetical protein